MPKGKQSIIRRAIKRGAKPETAAAMAAKKKQPKPRPKGGKK